MSSRSETKIMTCIGCPNSCRISLNFDPETHEILSMEGALCKRGQQWVKQELFHPMRTLCSSVRITDGREPLASVRTTGAISLDSIRDLMDLIRDIELKAPVEIGQIVLSHPLDTDCNVIITKRVDHI